MFGMGFGELIVIFVVILLFVGPKKLPEMAQMLGRAMSEFRRATDEIHGELNQTIREANIQSALEETEEETDKKESKESTS